MESLVSTALSAIAIYAAIGVLFALWFVSRGHRRLDAAAISFWGRLMILPASAALWPLLLVRALTTRVPLNTVEPPEDAA